MAALEERVDKHDRQIEAIQKLITQGMRWLSEYQQENRRAHAEFRKDLKRLEASQERTDKALQRLIGSLERGGDGNARNVYVQ